MSISKPATTQGDLPDPGGAGTLDELVGRLRSLKVWAGDPSYETITDRINAGWRAAGRPASELARRGTVVDCFRDGRRRINADLVVAVVRALHPDAGYVAQWAQALRVVGGEARAAAQVRAQDALPPDLVEFTGRGVEVDRLRRALRRGAEAGDTAEAGDAAVILAIEGMAGVGKTQLATHAGHLLANAQPFEQVLWVDLRGFHPDPAQPPADPAAVLDSFLRLLGVSGQQIPHDLPARSALYRSRLAGRRTLVVLDNAADEVQIEPLLPHGLGCVTLVTSRRGLDRLTSATHLTLDVFLPDEAVEFLKRAMPETPVGDDPDALLRVAQRCGHLPLALTLVVGQMRHKPGWTVTDHADWLDERHRRQRLDAGVELALRLSYQDLPAHRQRLLRLLSLHPGPDFDSHAAAALAGADPAAADEQLHRLCAEHLVRQATPGRYASHDLVRAYAAERATDEERPPDRRAALTRLLDHYLHAAATAMDMLYPADRHRRPEIPRPATPAPPMIDGAAARAWLDAERANLVAATAVATTHGWSDHATRLAATLDRYLIGGHFTDATTVFDQARTAARRADDQVGEAQALFGLGTVHGRLGRHAAATDYLHQALERFRAAGDRIGQARTLGNLGAVAHRRAQYRQAADYHEQARALFAQAGDKIGEARALNNLGDIEARLGRYDVAADHHYAALALDQQIGDQAGEAAALTNLGTVESQRGRHAVAADHHQRALAVYRLLGHQSGQAWTLDGIGVAYTGLGRPDDATTLHQQALDLFQEIGERDGEAWALNGLGEAARVAGHLHRATAHHTAALAIATEAAACDQQARAYEGLAHAYHAAGRSDEARRHWQLALAVYTHLGLPDADRIRAHLTTTDGHDPPMNLG